MVTLQAKAIIPDNISQLERKGQFFQFLMRAAVNRVAGVVMEEFKMTIKTWNKKPKFLKKTSRKDGGYSVLVYTEDTIYAYVTLGTKPHIIRPKNVSLLRFAPNSRPKTTPRLLTSSKGFVPNERVFAKEVHHPGTEAREFHIIIQQRAQIRLDLEIKNAMKVFNQTK